MADPKSDNGAPREEIHLPGPSLIPLAAAIGITLTLVGLILSWLFVAAGAIITLITIVRWVRTTREEIAELPETEL